MRRGAVKVARRFGWDISDKYLEWIEGHTPSLNALATQRRWAREIQHRPRFTLLVRSSVGMDLKRSLRSLNRQTYSDWTTVVLQSDAENWPAVSARVPSNCDFLGIMRAGDTFSPEALYEFARAVVGRHPSPDVLYCDEDYLAPDGRTRTSPVFKPCWSPETLLGYNYTGRLIVARRAIVEQAGGVDFSLGEAAEWDLMLRMSEQTERIERIPHCLYHNGKEAPSREIVHQAAVLKRHLSRIGIEEPQAIEQANSSFRVTWPMKRQPMVSVIIPTVNSPGLIATCLDGLLNKTDYTNMEVILVDSGTTDPITLSLYHEWTSRGSVSVVPLNEPFNYSVACNLGAEFAHGEYLLFLNNDMEIIEPGWLEELIRWAQRPGIGVVGPKLLYPDAKIQHAGMVLSSLGNHLFHRQDDDTLTMPSQALFGTANTYRNVLAVTGACQLLSRSLFDQAGGYDTRSLIAGSDVFLCLRAVKLGYRNLYTPFAALIHHESVTRGAFNPGDDLLLAAQLIRDLHFQEDPYFHPGLDPMLGRPALRPSSVGSSKHFLGRTIRRLTAFEVGDELMTLDQSWSPATILGRLSARFRIARVFPDDVGRDRESATWFVIDLLLRDESLSRRFPLALSEGAEGDFCNWLCAEGLDRHGLPHSAATQIRAAFSSQPGHQVGQLIDQLALENPLFQIARLPNLLEGLGTWLLQNGGRHGVSDRQVWWFLLEIAEDPMRELARTYTANPAWQKCFPNPGTPPGWSRFTRWLRERYRLDVTYWDCNAFAPSRVRSEKSHYPTALGSETL